MTILFRGLNQNQAQTKESFINKRCSELTISIRISRCFAKAFLTECVDLSRCSTLNSSPPHLTRSGEASRRLLNNGALQLNILLCYERKFQRKMPRFRLSARVLLPVGRHRIRFDAVANRRKWSEIGGHRPWT